MPYLAARLMRSWTHSLASIVSVGTVLTTLVGIIGALVKARSLSPEVKWATVALCLSGGVFALAHGIRRRSVLLRPDRFIISPDDPNHLVGRDADVVRVARMCAANSLSFVVGQSGAGKTALLGSGVMPYLHAGRDTPGMISLLPIRIDCSTLSWSNGLRTALSRELRALSDQQRQALGSSQTPTEPFEWLEHLAKAAPQRLLIILDQLDDYAFNHRDHLTHDHTFARPEALEQASPEWAALARLVRQDTIHVLMAFTLETAALLVAMRFKEPSITVLAPPEPGLIGPILEVITREDGSGPVVQHPDSGWVQLKPRLIRDLAAESGCVLPIQLAVCLDSLRRFRRLTPSEYASNGGVAGLERLHIERYVRDTAPAYGISANALLGGLVTMSSDDGKKTRRITRDEFERVVFAHATTAAPSASLVEDLERARIIRRQFGEAGEHLLLHHDYLARGIRAAHRKTNYWSSLLTEKEWEFSHSHGLLHRWRALLPVSTQLRMACNRLRARFTYGHHRAFALWSTLRTLPPLLLLSGVAMAATWFAQLSVRQSVERLYAGGAEWRRLAGAGPKAGREAILFGLSEPGLQRTLFFYGPIFSHIAVDLDPTGIESERVLHELIEPHLREDDWQYATAAAMVGASLHLRHSVALGFARRLTELLTKSWNADQMSEYRAALRLMLNRLDASEIGTLAVYIAEHVRNSSNSEYIAELSGELGELAPRMGPDDARRVALQLIERL